MSDWKSTAGPRQAKQATDALSKLQWHGHARRSITDHSGPEGHVLYAICGAVQKPVLDALNEIGEKYKWTITASNFKDIREECFDRISSIPIPIDDTRHSPEERAILEAERNQIIADRQAAEALKAVKFDECVAKVKARYPWAASYDDKGGGLVQAAKNIRRELADKFPGVKFSVTTERFAGGNSLDVKWDFGPTSKEVDLLLSKYRQGDFDGMEDIYRDDMSPEGEAYRSVMGSAKYTHSKRGYGTNDGEKSLWITLSQHLCEFRKLKYEGLDQLRVLGDCDERTIAEHVRTYLHATSFPAGAIITGLKEEVWDEARVTGVWEPYSIDFEIPDTDKCHSGPVYDGPEDPHQLECSEYKITSRVHTKKGNTFFLVELSKRVDRDAFDRLRDSAKDSGGWYSRAWRKTPGGFGFDTLPEATSWAASALLGDGAQGDPMGVDRQYEDDCARQCGA